MTQASRRVMLWARRSGLARKLGYLLLAAASAAGIVTYGVLTGAGPDPTTVIVLLYADLAILLLLGLVVARRIARVWAERRSGAAGSKLHVRLVMLFSLVALTPTVLMAVFSVLFFNIGVQAWFSERVRTALEEADAVARGYMEEHQRIIVGDALAMANDLNREQMLLFRNPQLFADMVATQAAIRGLSEAMVFDANGRVVARSGYSLTGMQMNPEQVPIWLIDRARAGDTPIWTSDTDDGIRALVQLQGGFTDTFLFVGRLVDPKVVGHMERTSAAVSEYERLEGQRSELEITFTLVFATVALLLLLAAVWVGLSFANYLARPIITLIDASERLRQGDWSVRVTEVGVSDELGTLSRAFNRMTSQLARQRQELMEANRELDERSRFTETVLAGVTAGVIGLDELGRVTLPNRSACDMLGLAAADMEGRSLAEVAPEMAELYDTVSSRADRLAQGEVKLARDGRSRTLIVRIAPESLDGEVLGYVVTFDDITELVGAQRKAAWADVARRIAHEIKNPLTPIQLSAERLKRKYLKEIESDKDTFQTLVDTIVRQVGDIGRMVDEFSSFARMPAPQPKLDNLTEIVRQALFLQRQGYTDVSFETELPPGPVMVNADGRLLGQALTNLTKNAVEAIQGRDGEGLAPGRVQVRLWTEGDRALITILDNGKGLPAEQRDRLTEPYVTTRAKGTGLGLAIVKKIMEDHGGELMLEDGPDGIGACIRLVLPLAEPASPTSQETANTHGDA